LSPSSLTLSLFARSICLSSTPLLPSLGSWLWPWLAPTGCCPLGGSRKVPLGPVLDKLSSVELATSQCYVTQRAWMQTQELQLAPIPTTNPSTAEAAGTHHKMNCVLFPTAPPALSLP
jgi:hypothetical protein